MKKLFFLAAVVIAAVNVNAESAVYDWAANVGGTVMGGTTATGTVKVHGSSVNCIAFANGYIVDGAVKNYAEITPNSGSFLKDDIVDVEFCINNSDASKNAVLGVFAGETELAAVAAANTYNKADDPSSYQFQLSEDAAKLVLGRASGNTKLCVTKLQVIRGGEIIPVAVAPIFSKPAGEYFEPFKFAITSSSADKIFYSLNGGAFVEYTDSIEVNEYDQEYHFAAYATLEGAENSNTVEATYKLVHFVPRPAFQARKTIDLSGITSADIQIESGDNGILSTRSMDGEDCPTIAYKHIDSPTGGDSLLLVTFKNREGVLLRYKNGSDKNPALTMHSNYLQTDSKNAEIYVDGVEGGDTVVFVVTAKGSAPRFDYTYSSACYIDPYQPDDDSDPCFTDGEVFTKSDARVDNDYIGWTNLVFIVQEGHTKIRLKEVSNGFRLAKIQIGAFRSGAPMGIEDNFMNQKAIKRFVDGQMVIEKGGRRFNVLGTEIK